MNLIVCIEIRAQVSEYNITTVDAIKYSYPKITCRTTINIRMSY